MSCSFADVIFDAGPLPSARPRLTWVVLIPRRNGIASHALEVSRHVQPGSPSRYRGQPERAASVAGKRCRTRVSVVWERTRK